MSGCGRGGNGRHSFELLTTGFRIRSIFFLDLRPYNRGKADVCCFGILYLRIFDLLVIRNSLAIGLRSRATVTAARYVRLGMSIKQDTGCYLH